MNSRFTCAAAALIAAFSGLASADDIDCSGSIGAVIVDGNVLVAAPCDLQGTSVKGNVELFGGGVLVARNIDVVGNVQAANAASADVSDSTIGGSIQLDELTGEITVARSEITGSIQVVGNWSPINLVDNFVGADIQAFSNTGSVDITGNTVDGNLQCKENDPAPTGSENLVHGNKEDQCANLSPAVNGTGGTVGSASVSTSADAISGGGAIHPWTLGGLLLLVSAFRHVRRANRRLVG